MAEGFTRSSGRGKPSKKRKLSFLRVRLGRAPAWPIAHYGGPAQRIAHLNHFDLGRPIR
jgi:hypothetical protein